MYITCIQADFLCFFLLYVCAFQAMQFNSAVIRYISAAKSNSLVRVHIEIEKKQARNLL